MRFGGQELLILLVIGAFLMGLYFVPTIIAIARRSSRLVPVILINLLGGWTVIGWIIALILALQSEEPQPRADS